MQGRKQFGTALTALLVFASTMAFAQTKGPNGEPPTPTSEIKLSDAEIAKLKAELLKKKGVD